MQDHTWPGDELLVAIGQRCTKLDTHNTVCQDIDNHDEHAFTYLLGICKG
jgi:hypothetical protein